MNKGYTRDVYKSDLGYEITHTEGFSAEDSTISYLHQTPRFILYYFIKGKGNIKIEGKTYKIDDGDIIFLNPQEMFCCRIDSNTYHERIVLHFNDEVLKNFPKDCNRLFSPFINRNKGERNSLDAKTVTSYKLDTIINEILSFSQTNEEMNEILALCKIIELLYRIYDISENKNIINVINSTENSTINKILKYLNNNYTKQITIDIISKEFSLDKSYMSHLFKEHVGIPIWSYVIFRRISFFNGLVRDGIAIDEASRTAGFNNYSNFFRLYKKHMGITPMEYKRQLY